METIESLRKEIEELKSDVAFYKRYAYNTISFQAMHKDFLDVPAIYYSYSEINGSYLNVDTFPGIDYEKAYHNLTRKFEKGYAWVMKLIYDKELVEKFRSLAEQKIDDLLAERNNTQSTKFK